MISDQLLLWSLPRCGRRRRLWTATWPEGRICLFFTQLGLTTVTRRIGSLQEEATAAHHYYVHVIPLCRITGHLPIVLLKFSSRGSPKFVIVVCAQQHLLLQISIRGLRPRYKPVSSTVFLEALVQFFQRHRQHHGYCHPKAAADQSVPGQNTTDVVIGVSSGSSAIRPPHKAGKGFLIGKYLRSDMGSSCDGANGNFNSSLEVQDTRRRQCRSVILSSTVVHGLDVVLLYCFSFYLSHAGVLCDGAVQSH